MPDIRIQHVIFTRVERAYSPKHASGYQIVYQSPALDSETAQVEKRVQCFQPNGRHIERNLFFWTEKNQAVLVRSVPLFKPDREVIDRDQRDAFLAHALVLSQEDFARVKNDPFAIFDAAEDAKLFVKNVKQLVLYLNRTQQLSEQLNVPIREKQREGLLEGWSEDEVHKLYRLGLQAPTMLQHKQSLLMLSDDPDDVYMLLSTIMLLLLPYERAACTFDTFVDGCLPSAGTFWAVGSGRPISNPGYLLLPLAEHSVNVKEGGKGSPDPKVRAYSEWLLHVLRNGSGFWEVNEEVHSAQIIAEAFLTKTALPDKPLNERALKHFSEANAQAIDSTLYQILAGFFEARLAEEIVTVLKMYRSQQEILSIVSQEKCDARWLAKFIYYWRLNGSSQFKYWDELLKFAEKTGYPRLLLLASLKTHPRLPFLLTHYEKLRELAIKSLSKLSKLSAVLNELLDVRFRSSMTIMQPGVAPIPTEVGSSTGLQLSDEEFFTLVLALLQSNAGNALGTLFIQRVATLRNKKMLQSLAKAVKKAQNVSPEFVKVIEQY